VTGTYYGTGTQLCISYSLFGSNGLLCKRDSVCKQLQPCPPPCCLLNIVSDSSYCDTAGIKHFVLTVNGCGKLYLSSPNISVTGPYVLTGANTVITGTTTATGSPLCIKLALFDSLGNKCKDTFVCIKLGQCPPPCCRIAPVIDSIKCGNNGQYLFWMTLKGCGKAVISHAGTGAFTISSSVVTLTTAGTQVTGTYTPAAGGTLLCITLLVYDPVTQLICRDTTICAPLPPCGKVPCLIKKTWCGNIVTYSYAGSTAGLTFNWTFPGGVPSTGTGPSVSVSFVPPYSSIVTLVITNTVGGQLVAICKDTIRSKKWYVETGTVVANGNVLIAVPDTANDKDSLAYQWYINDTTPIKGANDRFLVPDKSGSYTCRRWPIGGVDLPFDPYPCGWPTDKYNFKITGIDEISADDWTVVPNPSNTTCTVVIKNTKRDNMTIRIIDALGAEVYTTTMEAGRNKDQIDVSSYAAGVYHIIISSAEYQGVKRLIVNH
jgi:hypothetical protein